MMSDNTSVGEVFKIWGCPLDCAGSINCLISNSPPYLCPFSGSSCTKLDIGVYQVLIQGWRKYPASFCRILYCVCRRHSLWKWKSFVIFLILSKSSFFLVFIFSTDHKIQILCELLQWLFTAPVRILMKCVFVRFLGLSMKSFCNSTRSNKCVILQPNITWFLQIFGTLKVIRCRWE